MPNVPKDERTVRSLLSALGWVVLAAIVVIVFVSYERSRGAFPDTAFPHGHQPVSG